MKEYMEMLLKLSNIAKKRGEVPISAIIVQNGKIISKAYNKREKTKNPLMHAEIIAITKAAKKLKTWKLDDCEIFVSLKPCNMCSFVISEARIKKVYYVLDNNKVINNKINYIKLPDNNEFKMILSGFFEDKR